MRATNSPRVVGTLLDPANNLADNAANNSLSHGSVGLRSDTGEMHEGPSPLPCDAMLKEQTGAQQLLNESGCLLVSNPFTGGPLDELRLWDRPSSRNQS